MRRSMGFVKDSEFACIKIPQLQIYFLFWKPTPCAVLVDP
jgi:hypothetical protein